MAWKQLALLFADVDPWQQAVNDLSAFLDSDPSGPKLPVTIRFRSGQYDQPPLSRVECALNDSLVRLKHDAVGPRVVMVIASAADVAAIMLRAYGCDMRAGWGWLSLVGLSTGSPVNPADATMLRQAANGWIFFEDYVAPPVGFGLRVRNATSHAPPSEYFDEAITIARPTYFACSLYDSIMMYAVAANKCSLPTDRWKRDLPATGKCVVENMMNTSINSMSAYGWSGRVELDKHGDMVPSVGVMNLISGSDAELQSVLLGVYHGQQRMFNATRGRLAVWPGGSLAIPTDPVPPEVYEFNTTWLLIGAAAGAIAFVSAVLFIMVKRYKNVQHLVKIVFTEIFDLALSIFLDIANVFTCGLSCAYALLEVGSVKYPGKYKVAYAVCICFATAGTIPAIGLRARTMHRLRLHFLDLAQKCKDVRVWDESVKQWQAYGWETDMEKRKRNICIVMVLQGLLQDVPFTFINMLLIFYDNSLKEQELLVRPSRCLPSGSIGHFTSAKQAPLEVENSKRVLYISVLVSVLLLGTCSANLRAEPLIQEYGGRRQVRSLSSSRCSLGIARARKS
jgi:hypothetical protein